MDQFADFLLTEVCPENGDLFALKQYLKQENIETVVRGFIKFVLPYREQIFKRDNRFFIHNTKIFGDLPEDKVVYFKKMWNENKISPEDKEAVWEYFKTLACLCVDYIRASQK
jgi:hypothetical protein